MYKQRMKKKEGLGNTVCAYTPTHRSLQDYFTLTSPSSWRRKGECIGGGCREGEPSLSFAINPHDSKSADGQKVLTKERKILLIGVESGDKQERISS